MSEKMARLRHVRIGLAEGERLLADAQEARQHYSGGVDGFGVVHQAAMHLSDWLLTNAPRLLAATRRDAQRAEGWRPIETAPRDGTVFDIWQSAPGLGGRRIVDCKWGRPRMANWGDRYGADQDLPPQWMVVDGFALDRRNGEATHWQPRPQPPSVEDLERLYAGEKSTDEIVSEVGAKLRAEAREILAPGAERLAELERLREQAKGSMFTFAEGPAHAYLSSLLTHAPALIAAAKVGQWNWDNAAYALKQAEKRTEGLTNAARSVLEERDRQRSVEGYTPAQDDQYEHEELAQAAACYARVGHPEPKRMHMLEDDGAPPEGWPWQPQYWKPRSHRENLVRAGALILAEIERLDRLPSSPKDTNHD